MNTRADSYEAVCAAFEWRLPGRFNIGVDVCDKHVAAGRGAAPALIHLDQDGTERRYDFAEVARLSNRLANVLLGHGLARGDRVAVLLPQTPETALAHVAAYKAGLVAMPLFTLFGAEALEHRLTDSGARALITDRAGVAKLAEIRDRLPELHLVLATDADRLDGEAGSVGFWPALDRASDAFDPVDSAPDDPALLAYT